MANVSLKTDFKDGDKLFGQQLNNNFAVIKAALEAMNKIVWQDDPDDSVTAFRGTTEEINQRDIIDGQLLYDTSTGETYIDVGSQRISTGSGNAIHIGSDTPTNPATQIWVDPNEPLQLIGTEVVNSMEGTESNKAPSVQAVKNYVEELVEDVSNEFTTTYTKNYIKALYYPQTKMVVLTYSIRGITTSNNWTTIISTNNDRYKANADYYDAAYSTTATFGVVGIANNSKNIIGYQKGMFMGTLVWYTD